MVYYNHQMQRKFVTEISISQESFDSSYRGNYKGEHIDKRLLVNSPVMSPIMLKILKYQTSHQLINVQLLGLQLLNSLEYLNKLIEYNFQIHEKIRTSSIITNNLSEINYKKELIIHIMKRIIDDLIMVQCLYYDLQNIQQKNQIQIASIGDLSKNQQNTNIIKTIKSDLNYDKYNTFFNVINVHISIVV